MATVKVSDFPRRHTQHHQFQDCELGIAIWTVSDASAGTPSSIVSKNAASGSTLRNSQVTLIFRV